MFGLFPNRIAEKRVIRAAEILFREGHLSEHEQLAALQEAGFTQDQSMRLLLFMPTAFITPQLEEHNLTLHPEVSGRDANGKWVLAQLRKQPEYVAALKLARRHRQEGVLMDEVYDAIAESSAEADVVRQASDEGVDMAGGIVATSLPASDVASYFLGPLRPFPLDASLNG
jgi:hypothetical protein